MIRLFIFILVLLFCLRSPVHSQNNDSLEWAMVGTTWWYGFDGISSRTDCLMMKVVKDTTVNGKNARIIEGTLYRFDRDTVKATDYYDQGRIIIHQEGDSIFYLRENRFELLYDFSLKEGDTMRIITPAPYNPEANQIKDTMIHITVESVGEIVIDNDTLRTQEVLIDRSRFSSNYSFSGEIIEKIGNQWFFLPYDGLLCDAACPIPLRCYQDDELFYKRVDIACDSTYVISSTDQDPGNEEINLYPNPVLRGQALQVQGMDVKDWILRNMQGKVISKGSNFLGSSTIDLPDNAVAGMYFMELRSGKKRYVKKVIVQ